MQCVQWGSKGQGGKGDGVAETEEREMALRQLAQQARLERGGGMNHSSSALPNVDDESIDRSTTKNDDRKSVETMGNKVSNTASFDKPATEELSGRCLW